MGRCKQRSKNYDVRNPIHPSLELDKVKNVELETTLASKGISEIKTYKLRWFILIVICLINISNSINWICYSAISNYTAQFYNVDYSSVNFLSLVFLITSIPIGLISIVVINYFGIRLSLILAGWLNFVGSLLRVISSIYKESGEPLVSYDNQFTVLMVGQVICSLANTFSMLVSTNFAQSWYKESQRALANSIALSSNTFGLLIGSFISPLIVDSDLMYVTEMSNLNIIFCALSFVPALLASFITRSEPPTPPHDTTEQEDRNNEEIKTFSKKVRVYLQQIKMMFQSKPFLLLMFAFSIGLGIFNGVLTLIQQIFCVRGYPNDDVGMFGALIIGCGILGSIVTGVLVDKTKKFQEVAKAYFCLCSLFYIFMTVLQCFNNDHGIVKYLLIVSFCLIGLFGLPLLPVFMELSVECMYPIPEATPTGFLFIGGQLIGIVIILIDQAAGKPVSANSNVYQNIQKCLNPNSTYNNSSTLLTPLTILDYEYPLIGQTTLISITAIVFTIFFKCPYLRLNNERSTASKQKQKQTEINIEKG